MASRGHGARGALVQCQIAQSPFEVPDAFARATATAPDQAARAQEALAWLGDTAENRAVWAETARQDRTVPTVLRKLDPGPTARLL